VNVGDRVVAGETRLATLVSVTTESSAAGVAGAVK
jgi:hypothetical protein